MSKFEAILRTFNNNSTAINQVSMSSIQSINNWSTIADNMLKLNSTALKLTEVYGNIKIPNSAWTTTTIVGATLGIVFSIYQSVSLFFEFKNLPKEIARVNEFLESSQTKQRKDALSIKNMRDKGLTDSDTQTSTDTSEVSIVEETANTNKPGSKKVSQTKRNTAKLVKDFAERWGKLIKNAFRSVMAAATVYFFIMELISINQLKQDMREWEQMLGPGGSLEQDEKDLVILLDAIAQDISSLGTASYIAILDFSNSFGVLAMLNPPLSNQFLGLSQLWNG